MISGASEQGSGDGDGLVAPLEGRITLKDMNEHVQEVQQSLIEKIDAVSDGVNGRIDGMNARIDALADSVGNLSTNVQRIMAMFVPGEHPAQQPIPTAPVQQPIPVPQIPQIPQVPQMPQVPQQPAFQQPAQGLQVPDGHGYPPLRPLAPGPIPSGRLREDNGDLSLDVTATRRRNMTAQEERVWNAWPEVVLQRDMVNAGQAQEKNKVTIPPNLRLNKANYTVFPKLKEIQKLLRMNFIPWNLWITRISLKLNDDFLRVQAWANQLHPNWLTFVKAII
jgi:hypothetical protein